MDRNIEIPWNKIHTFLIDCGSIRNPKEFCVQIIKKIITLIPYDQARIYFINDNEAVYDEYLVGVNKRWPHLYYEYYSQIENGRYSLFPNNINSWRIPKPQKFFRDWTNHECDEFFTDYIRPQGIRYTGGFSLHDNNDARKAVLILDRTNANIFTYKELYILDIIHVHLNNLHKNLYVNMSNYGNCRYNTEFQQFLTMREAEIMDLLVKGVTPKNISKKLSICQSTVYKHIAHIYEKMNVSTRQELLVKLLNTQSTRDLLYNTTADGY